MVTCMISPYISVRPGLEQLARVCDGCGQVLVGIVDSIVASASSSIEPFYSMLNSQSSRPLGCFGALLVMIHQNGAND